MTNKINQSIIKERARFLIGVSRELEISYMRSFLHQEVEVLVEETIDGYSYGHTGNYLYLKMKGEFPHNEIIKVKIVKKTTRKHVKRVV